MVGIYKITSPKGRIYIGQSMNIRRRFRCYKRLACKEQPQIYASLKKHGVDKHKFEIVTECKEEELNQLERYYQELYNCLGKGGLNCVYQDLGDGIRIVSDETRRKISIANTGRKFTKSHKKNLSKARKGIKLSKEHVEKMRISSTGKKHTDETKLKIGLKHKGKKISDKHKLILSKGRIWKRPIGYNGNKSKINHKDSKLVINTETGIYYDNIASAARSVCMPSSSLSYRLSGSMKNITSFKYA